MNYMRITSVRYYGDSKVRLADCCLMAAYEQARAIVSGVVVDVENREFSASGVEALVETALKEKGWIGGYYGNPDWTWGSEYRDCDGKCISSRIVVEISIVGGLERIEGTLENLQYQLQNGSVDVGVIVAVRGDLGVELDGCVIGYSCLRQVLEFKRMRHLPIVILEIAEDAVISGK